MGGPNPNLNPDRALLQRLKTVDERAARVAELRLLGRLDDNEIAGYLKIHTRSVKRRWLMANLWVTSGLLNQSAGQP